MCCSVNDENSLGEFDHGLFKIKVTVGFANYLAFKNLLCFLCNTDGHFLYRTLDIMIDI